MENTNQSAPTKHIPSQVLVEYFLKHEQTLSFDDYDEASDEYIVHLHIPKALVINNIANRKAKNTEQTMSSKKVSTVTDSPLTLRQILAQQTASTPITDSISAMFADFNDDRDYKTIINEAREERMAKYL